VFMPDYFGFGKQPHYNVTGHAMVPIAAQASLEYRR